MAKKKKAVPPKSKIKVVEGDEPWDSPTPEPAEAVEEMPSNEAEAEPTGDQTVATKKAARKPTPKPADKVNKSQVVRDYAVKHGLSQKDSQKISDALGGEEAGYPYGTVYQALKPKDGTKEKKATRGKKASSGETGGNGHATTDFIKSAFSMGLDTAIDLLETIKKSIS